MERKYATKGERQKAYRDRKKGLVCATVDEAVVNLAREDERLPWPLNKGKAPRWGEGVAMYIPPTEDEKRAMEEYGVKDLSETDRAFNDKNPGYYRFGRVDFERECWMCGEKFRTRLEFNKFCGPEHQQEWLKKAFTKKESHGNV